MGRAASHSGSSGSDDRAGPAGPDASGRMLARRYRLTGGRLGSGVAAADTRSGVAVQLDAVPLPELVTPFDQDREQLPVTDDTAARALDRATFAADAVPDHPRLAQVFEVFAEDGYLWVVGEAVRGVPLGVLLDRAGAVGPYRAAELAGDLVSALRAVHAVGLVHGNVTVETVTVCDDGTALLGGLAVGAAQEALCGGPGSDIPGAGVPASAWTPARTRARDARRVVVGAAPERWAPEQRGPATGTRLAKEAAGPGLAVGPAADAWALGALLHRALTGEPLPGAEPGDPRSDVPGPVALRPGDSRPGDSRPGDSRPGVPRQVRDGQARGGRGAKAPDPLGPLGPLVGRLLATDPQARPGLAEVEAQLRQLLSRAPEPMGWARPGPAALPPGPRRTALLGRAGSAGDSAGQVEQPHHHAAPHQRPDSSRRSPALLGAVLLGGMLLIVVSTLVIAALVAR